MTYIIAAPEVITNAESRPEANLEVEMLDSWPSLVISHGNLSPSSDSGLGSEDEQLFHVFANLGEDEDGELRTLSELTGAMARTTELTGAMTLTSELTTAEEIRDTSDISSERQDSSCEESSSESLSLTLTSQNPSRIDVKTLYRSKVSIDCKIKLVLCHNHTPANEK